jgi:DNA-binding transcriptional LysR family regulator
MDHAGKLETFVQVVNAGSYSAAARAMGLTPSAVSKLIARIEDHLGARLINRSTRQLTLTPEGEIFHRHCLKIIADIQQAEEAVVAQNVEPRGRLRINSSLPIAIHRIQSLIPEFLARYPRMSVDLSLNDEVVDLVEERADVAIRIGPLQDTSLRARKICSSRRVIVAAPDYLERHGTPATPADLAQHNCLAYDLKNSLNAWPFKIENAQVNVTVDGNFRGNNGETLRHLALAGTGIARLAWFQVGEDVRDGHLVPLLEDFHPGDTQGIYAVFVNHKFTAARVRCFVDFLVEKFGRAQPWLGAASLLRLRQAEGFQRLADLLVVGFQERREACRVHPADVESTLRHEVLVLLAFVDFLEQRLITVRDLLRHALRASHDAPNALVPFVTRRFLHRRHVGEQRRTLLRHEDEATHAAGRDQRLRFRHRAGDEVDAAGGEVGHGGRRARARHPAHLVRVDAFLLQQPAERHVPASALTRARGFELAGLGRLDRRDQILERLVGRVRAHMDRGGVRVHHRQRRKLG